MACPNSARRWRRGWSRSTVRRHRDHRTVADPLQRWNLKESRQLAERRGVTRTKTREALPSLVAIAQRVSGGGQAIAGLFELRALDAGRLFDDRDAKVS